jgi:hypothetical protein
VGYNARLQEEDANVAAFHEIGGGSKVAWLHMQTVAYTGYMDKRTGGMAVCSQMVSCIIMAGRNAIFISVLLPPNLYTKRGLDIPVS